MLSSFDWLRPSLGVDGGLATLVNTGDLVQHRNGGQWGRVLRVVPQSDGTAELQIEGICRPNVQWDDPSVRWWATYHLRDWAPCYGPVRKEEEPSC
jgi:hypothetical protein